MTIQNKIIATVLADTGINLPADCLDSVTGIRYTDMGTFQIAPSMCGPMAILFKEISVTIKVAVAPAADVKQDGSQHPIGYLMYDYKYTHSQGGSNGYDVRKEVLAV
jgi:hypothetical protein